MKKLIFKPYEKIIIALLGLIGLLTGCDLIHPPVAEYGVPYANYELTGTVTDSITSIPIQNIKVTVTNTHTYTEKDSTFTRTDTLVSKGTDKTGKYDIRFEFFPLEELTFEIKTEDNDGPANGGDFSPVNRQVTFKSSDLSGGKGWYNGKALKTIIIKLKKK